MIALESGFLDGPVHPFELSIGVGMSHLSKLVLDAVTRGRSPHALSTMLYRQTDCLSRAGASVEYLARSASFLSAEKIAPSNPGTNHLGPCGGNSQGQVSADKPRVKLAEGLARFVA
jgi:hypothetical protein